MPRLLPLALVLAACSARPAAPVEDDLDGPAPVTEEIVGVWEAAGTASLDDPGTWECALLLPFGESPNGLVQATACMVNEVSPLWELAYPAPVLVWASGPHEQRIGSLGLDLDSKTGFGHYDSDFVRWAADHLTPDRPSSRALARPVYDAHARGLARSYWLAYGVLEDRGFPAVVPGALLDDYAAGLEVGYAEWSSRAVDRDLIEEAGNTAGRLDPSVSAIGAAYESTNAFGFWVRRRHGGSAAAFRDGLGALLRALDADWLRAWARDQGRGLEGDG